MPTRALLLVPVLLLAACGAGESTDPDDAPLFDEGDAGQGLFTAPDCTDAALCTAPAVSLPQCFAAAREGSFQFEFLQTLDVPVAGPYNFARLPLRRLYAPADTVLRVELLALTGGFAALGSAATLTSGDLVASMVSRTSDWVTVRFNATATLEAAGGGAPKYALRITVPSGRASFGIACTATTNGFTGGSAYTRKLRSNGVGGWTAGEWRMGARDLNFALGFRATSPLGGCSSTPGATCDDGNTTSGDGCSASCQFEPGFTCSGHPATCADTNECATAGTCGARELCRNTPGSYSCDCRTGTVRVSGVCEDRTQMAAWPIPDSTSIGCTNGSSAITCPAPGEAYYGQDANYLSPAPQFVVNGGGADTVTENVTGLTWQKTVLGGGTWENSLKYCEERVQGGYDDWRMPSAIEMVALVDFGARNTGGVDLGYFTWDGNTSGEFWTTSDQGGGSALAWDRGFVPRAKTINRKVRCVRSAIPDASVLAANRYSCEGGSCAGATATVTDLKTGLTWERADGEYNPNSWSARLDRCENLVLAGHDDWRLPSAKELFSIVDQNTGAIAPVLPSLFDFIFSSTPEIPGFTNRAYILFRTSLDVTTTSSGGRARCVR